ncbi:type II toxin-antitoxin system VapC family toxin [Candidatus Nanohalovita haloferacivicina]|uniref:type II toxin-antitoxin system VapC family toxin n=1 Tax=Candidatus Nanohalovita haloferacivicina TaxID=2978046 RepID=UPI00325F9730|nr:PIN domain containing protein [Candidatus Nanohalobia archaeon BNXNv]
MYVETDFILALLKEDDWLSDKAEQIYRENRKDLWTSEYTLLELMLVAYREDRNVLKTVSETIELLEVRGDSKDIESAAAYVQQEEMTPFDALHLVKSDGEKIVSSDKEYDKYTERRKLEE